MHIHKSMCTQIQIHKYKYKNTFSPRHLIIYHSLAAPQLRNVITGRRAGNFFGGRRFAKENFFSRIFAQETSSAGDLQKKISSAGYLHKKLLLREICKRNGEQTERPLPPLFSLPNQISHSHHL